jgi:hypothetical protein
MAIIQFELDPEQMQSFAVGSAAAPYSEWAQIAFDSFHFEYAFRLALSQLYGSNRFFIGNEIVEI